MKKSNKIIVSRYSSPCGELILGSFNESLCLCDWITERHRDLADNRLRKLLNAEFAEGESPVIQTAVRQLDEYFEGTRRHFDIPLLFVGTDFQKTVWQELLTIPYGTTISYGEMARNIGRPRSVRALANANGSNSISIFAPCHRVIGSDGSLTGYGGGLPVKQYLLRLESDPIVSAGSGAEASSLRDI